MVANLFAPIREIRGKEFQELIMTPIPPALNTLPDWLDRFPEPRTMPGGWDFSGWTETPPAPEPPASTSIEQPVDSSSH